MTVQSRSLEEGIEKLLQQRQKKRDDRWSRASYSPGWLLTEMPQELQDAVNSKWFPPGASVLDIGCGSGEIAVWMATQGFRVLGIDFAKAAIDKARTKHGDIKGTLAWQIVDICRASPGGTFEVLIDRGCLHAMPEEIVSSYAKHVAACSAPGTRFLLFHKTRPMSSKSSVLKKKSRRVYERIQTHFQSAFEILQATPTVLHRSSGEIVREPMAGLVIRMIRR